MKAHLRELRKPMICPKGNYCVCTGCPVGASDERNEKCAECCGVQCQAVDSLLIVPQYTAQHMLYRITHGRALISTYPKPQVERNKNDKQHEDHILIHAIISLAFGITAYLIAGTWATAVNWTPLDPTMSRLYGTALLGIGVSSLLAYCATRWEEV